MVVTPDGIVSDPLTVVYPVIVMLVPELINVRLLGTQTANNVRLAVPIEKRDPPACVIPLPSEAVFQPANE
jgi:hypothetical protein